MKATILDTETGIEAIVSGHHSWEWAENNWSCDCNRQRAFGLSEGDGICLGGKRFVVIAAAFDDPEDYEYTLAELNSDYPDELLRKHGIIVF